MRCRPISLRRANDFVELHHRHNGRTTRNGGFAISVVSADGALVGVAIVGNPLSATYMDGMTAEVLRVCTPVGAPKGVCSMLYAACWRAWKAMGGDRMVTSTLQSEKGTSLVAAGWRIVGRRDRAIPPGWNKVDHLDRAHQAVMLEPKFRWEPSDSRIEFSGGRR